VTEHASGQSQIPVRRRWRCRGGTPRGSAAGFFPGCARPDQRAWTVKPQWSLPQPQHPESAIPGQFHLLLNVGLFPDRTSVKATANRAAAAFSNTYDWLGGSVMVILHDWRRDVSCNRILIHFEQGTFARATTDIGCLASSRMLKRTRETLLRGRRPHHGLRRSHRPNLPIPLSFFGRHDPAPSSH
jgi:hypothetical protein